MTRPQALRLAATIAANWALADDQVDIWTAFLEGEDHERAQRLVHTMLMTHRLRPVIGDYTALATQENVLAGRAYRPFLEAPRDCRTCGGSRHVWHDDPGRAGYEYVTECPDCAAAGRR